MKVLLLRAGLAALTVRYPCHGPRRNGDRLAFVVPQEAVAMNECAKIDQALDEMLVGLGAIVLRLASPQVTRTAEARHALAQSVNQYAVCAARSDDPRVQRLKAELEDALKPNLRLVASR